MTHTSNLIQSIQWKMLDNEFITSSLKESDKFWAILDGEIDLCNTYVDEEDPSRKLWIWGETYGAYPLDEVTYYLPLDALSLK